MALRGTGGLEIRLSKNDQAREITPLVREFSWVESMVEGGFTWSLRLTTDGWNEWDDAVLGRRNLQFRLKFQSDRDVSTPWRTAVVDTSRMSYRSTAFSFVLRGSDRRLDLRQRDRTRAWPGRTVADIVREIGQEYGFDVFVERTAHVTDRWQCREDDWSFISRLADSAASASGRGDIYLWLDEDQLFFQAPQIQRSSDRRHALQEVENRVDRMVLAYNGREVDRSGGATLTAVSYDVANKLPRVFTVDREAAQTHPALARRVPRNQDDGLRVYPGTDWEAEGIEETARGQWGAYSPRYFSLRLDTRPDLTLKPGMIVEVQGALDRGKETPFLGRFVVLEVTHTLTAGGDPNARDEGGLITSAICYRREAYIGDDEPTGSSAINAGTRDRYQFGGEQSPTTVVVAEVLP